MVFLRRTDENAGVIDALADKLGGRVGVDGVLDDLNRQAHPKRVLGRAVSSAFAWDEVDQRSERWWPQGISTSADASDTEDIAGRKVLVSSWYSKSLNNLNKGCRVTFTDLESLRYRHVLLVVPDRDSLGRVKLKPLKVHAGGVVWCGPYLHIAATSKGIHTARLDDLMRVPDDLYVADIDEFGVHGLLRGEVATYGYRYVLPVRFSYQAEADEGHERMRYSFLSLDRSASAPELIAGEYGRGKQSTRLTRFPLDPETFHISSGEDGHARPLQLDPGGVAGMQGAVVVNDTWYVTSSRGPFGLGSVYAGKPGQLKQFRWSTPFGPEDIAYWPSTDLLWSLTEYPGRRAVFSMPRSRFS
ncbi:hypothetical protein [Nocardioides speluncae]|uniref:hypothetical protein n=1 Tax=Nocardioides speluncae TaxID=2670337 RepID=UPI000D696D98|nr:hypothetical protein [Nocardioides speluncae]